MISTSACSSTHLLPSRHRCRLRLQQVQLWTSKILLQEGASHDHTVPSSWPIWLHPRRSVLSILVRVQTRSRSQVVFQWKVCRSPLRRRTVSNNTPHQQVVDGCRDVCSGLHGTQDKKDACLVDSEPTASAQALRVLSVSDISFTPLPMHGIAATCSNLGEKP